jgi:hypothetical protein
MSDSVEAMLCARVDWANPELADTGTRRLWESRDHRACAVALIGHLRSRLSPDLGYSADFARQVLERASREEVVAARVAWEEALNADLLMPYHSNAFAAIGPINTLLGVDSGFCERAGQLVADSRDRWTEGFWGVTHGICEVLRLLWHLPECRDEDLIPWFGWLITKSDAEWARASRWNEASLGTSGHNWWVHTFAGFFQLGLFFPEFTGWKRFRSLAPEFFERELRLLFEPDGWSKEGSPGYNEFALAKFLEVWRLGTINGVEWSGDFENHLRTACDAMWKMLMPDGGYPIFGDSVRPGGYVGFHGANREDCAPVHLLRRRAARLGIGKARWVAEQLDPAWEESALLADEGEDLGPAYRALPGESVEHAPDTRLPQSGFYVMRQNWTPQADCCAIVAGSLGPMVTSHKHADLLSFELYSRGRRILVDNGYGVPTEGPADPDSRMWRVGTSSHNAVTVDGEPQVGIPREFRFDSTVVPVVDDWRSSERMAYFSGVHEGYLRLDEPVAAVRRKLFYLRGKYWILIDRFTPATAAAHTYRQYFHFAPEAEMDAGAVTTRGVGGNLRLLPVPGLTGDSAELVPCPHPIEGYENPQTATYTAVREGGAVMAAVMVPFLNDAAPAVTVRPVPVFADCRELTPWEATGLEILFGDERHLYVDLNMAWNLPWTCEGASGDARLFHSDCL